jgi:hypothetical protein
MARLNIPHFQTKDVLLDFLRQEAHRRKTVTLRSVFLSVAISFLFPVSMSLVAYFTLSINQILGLTIVLLVLMLLNVVYNMANLGRRKREQRALAVELADRNYSGYLIDIYSLTDEELGKESREIRLISKMALVSLLSRIEDEDTQALTEEQREVLSTL